MSPGLRRNAERHSALQRGRPHFWLNLDRAADGHGGEGSPRGLLHDPANQDRLLRRSMEDEDAMVSQQHRGSARTQRFPNVGHCLL